MPEFLAEQQTCQIDELLQKMGINEVPKCCDAQQQDEPEPDVPRQTGNTCPSCAGDLTTEQDSRTEPARYLCCVPCRYIESWWYVREDG